MPQCHYGILYATAKMILNEHQAKKVLASSGFNVPDGVVCESLETAELKASTLQGGQLGRQGTGPRWRPGNRPSAG